MVKAVMRRRKVIWVSSATKRSDGATMKTVALVRSSAAASAWCGR